MHLGDPGLRGGPRVLQAGGDCANSLGVSLCNVCPSGAFKASGEQQWVKPMVPCRSRTWWSASRSEAGEIKGSPQAPPLIHKTGRTKSFHAPASACCSRKVHLFISLKNVYGEKLSARENKISGEILPFVRYLLLWELRQWGWCLAWMCYAWEGWEEPELTKCPEQGDSATSVPACMTWLPDMAIMKLQRFKGSRRGGVFCYWCTRSLLRLPDQETWNKI